MRTWKRCKKSDCYESFASSLCVCVASRRARRERLLLGEDGFDAAGLGAAGAGVARRWQSKALEPAPSTPPRCTRVADSFAPAIADSIPQERLGRAASGESEPNAIRLDGRFAARRGTESITNK